MAIFEIVYYLSFLALESKSSVFRAWRGTRFGYFSTSLFFPVSIPCHCSVAILVAWTGVLHRSQCTRSLAAVFELSLITIVQCYLREKSDGLWDCILCHLTFNASLLLIPVTLG